MAQRWSDLLFAHWPVATSELRPLIPDGLELDTWAGEGWVGIVPFRMSGVRLRGTPALPWLSAFPELNLRTYVRVGDRPGVWFFSLDAANPVAVAIARRWFHLPYFRARMSCRDDDGEVIYDSRRVHRGAPAATLAARYRPIGNVTTTHEGTHEHWLTARFCLYAEDGRRRLWRGEIDHPPWPLQSATATLEYKGTASGFGITLPDRAPICHFVRTIDVRCWRPGLVTRSSI